MSDTIDLGASIDHLGAIALRIKDERDDLLGQTKEAFRQIRILRAANERLRAEIATLRAAAGLGL